MSEQDRLLDAALQVSDGEAVDWERMERTADDPLERRRIEGLKALARIAAACRSTDPAPARPSPQSPPLLRWGPLELIHSIGRGAKGEVFRARDTRLDMEVALKLLPADPEPADPRPFSVIREGRLMAKVRHRNVISVFGADQFQGRTGIWMELVEGTTLHDLLALHGPFGARETALFGIDLCQALAAVHAAGLIHQDVKARNVIREQGGRLVLMDLGSGLEVSTLAAQGVQKISGTPVALAPEIFEGGAPSPASDIYSLGVLLFQLVTGDYPIVAESIEALVERHRRGERRRLRDLRPDLPGPFVEVVEKALAPAAADRFATAGEFELALVHTLEPAPALGVIAAAAGTPARSSRRIWPAAVFFALMIPLVLWGLVSLRSASTPGSQPQQIAAPVREIAQPPRLSAEPKTPPPSPTPALPLPAPARHPVSAAVTSFQAQATIYRVGAGGREPLPRGAHLALHDSLVMDFSASEPVFLYVVNQDDRGHAYLLFPIPGLQPENPIPAEQQFQLPGVLAAEKPGSGAPNVAWTVDSQGGRERFLIVASRKRWTEFEKDAFALPRPALAAAAQAVDLPEAAGLRLRGLGGLSPIQGDLPAPGKGPADRLSALAAQLAGKDRSSGDVWVKEIDFFD